MVVLRDDLNDITDLESNARLLTWNEVVFCWVILKLSTYVNL